MVERSQSQYNPRTVSPPGWSIADLLAERGITQEDLARNMGRPLELINSILQGNAFIDKDAAHQLERELGTPADIWLRWDTRYRESLSRRRANMRIDSNARPTV